MNARIDLLEPTGPDTFVFARANETRVVGRVRPGFNLGPDGVASLAFDTSRAVLFEPTTGLQLYAPEPGAGT